MLGSQERNYVLYVGFDNLKEPPVFNSNPFIKCYNILPGALISVVCECSHKLDGLKNSIAWRNSNFHYHNDEN